VLDTPTGPLRAGTADVNTRPWAPRGRRGFRPASSRTDVVSVERT